ncbi:tRNA-binding protein [Aegicerativicinus sediminis]|uniref:tRNA-binding protein n=1 Tax=Aegicerativicinus sediminis TaxID=2893202 RepID=UPI001E4F960C|nr:tRNA-binding protein [Aegicerativicinus sediminis]
MIQFDDFNKVDIRVGTILEVSDFPKAHNPAYQILIDFGPLGRRKSSAQITALYKKENLIGKQILAVINFPEKQIANFKSQCLILGATSSEKVILLKPENPVPNGSKIS